MALFTLGSPYPQLKLRLLTLCIVAVYASARLAGYDQIAKTEEDNLQIQEKRQEAVPKSMALWQRKLAPGSGPVESVDIDTHDQERVLLCQGGIAWISQDKGLSYSPIFGPEPEQGVTATFHPTLPNTLFLATSQHFLTSINGGKDWTSPSPGLTFKWRPQAILVSSNKLDRIYITTQGEGIYRSDDSGRTWTAVNAGLPEAIGTAPFAPIESAVLDPTDPSTVYVAAEVRGVYKTTDGGETWTIANQGLPKSITRRTLPWILGINPSNPKSLLLWAQWPVHSERIDSAFFISRDGAATWRKIADGPNLSRVLAIEFVESRDALAIAITEDGVIRLSK